MEPGRVRDADVELVPRVPLDQEPGHVLHPGHVEEAAAPVSVIGPAEIPRDPPQHREMIPAVGSFPEPLISQPVEQHGAMAVAVLGIVVRPEEFPDG